MSVLGEEPRACVWGVGEGPFPLAVKACEQVDVVDCCLFRVLPPLKELDGEIPLALGPGMIKCENTVFTFDDQRLGQAVRYSSKLILLHVLSNKWLAPDFTQGGAQPSSRTLALSGTVKTLQVPSQCELAPYDNRMRCDDMVDLSKPLHIYFPDSDQLHYQLAFDRNNDNRVLLSLFPQCWEMRRYDSYAPGSDKVLHFGQIVAVSNRKLSAWLTALSSADHPLELVPDLATQLAETGADADLPSIMRNTYKTVLTFESRDFNIYWSFEREDRFVGGPVEKGTSIWVKHIATQRYLCPNGTLAVSKTEENAMLVLESQEEDEDRLIHFNELVQMASPQGLVLTSEREQAADYVWSALFHQSLQPHESQRKEIYLPVAFSASGARKKDVDFEVVQPEEHLALNLLLSLCYRPTFSKFRLFYRRLEAKAQHWTSREAETAMEKEFQMLTIYYENLTTFLSSHPRFEEIQNVFFALGYHYDLLEGLALHKKKTADDYRSFVLLEGLDEATQAQASQEMPQVRDLLSGLSNLLTFEVAGLLVKNNAYVCAQLLEDQTIVPALVQHDPATLALVLEYALDACTPGMKSFYTYLFLYQRLVKEEENSSLRTTYLRILSNMCGKMQGCLDTNARDLLLAETPEGERTLMISFNGDANSPNMSLLGKQIAFAPRRAMSVAFLQGIAVAEAAVSLLTSICRASSKGHQDLAAQLNLTPDFLHGCMAHPKVPIGLQVHLESLFVNLFLKGESESDTVSEKMRLMCFVESDIRAQPEDNVSPLESPSADPVIKEAIQSELTFWLSSEPDSFLSRVLADASLPAQKAVWMLSYVQSRIQAVSCLIEWKQVNGLFVYAVKKAATAVLHAFSPDIPSESRAKHWSKPVCDFLFLEQQAVVVERKQAEDVSAADVDWSIQETYRDLLNLFKLILHWNLLNSTWKTLEKMLGDGEWKAQMSNPELKQAVYARYGDFFAHLSYTSHKSRLLRFLQPAQDPALSAAAPLLSSVSGSTSSFPAGAVAIIEGPKDLKDLKSIFMYHLLNSGNRYLKFSHEILHLLDIIANPRDSFYNHLKKAVFVEEQSLHLISAIMGEFDKVELQVRDLLEGKDPENLSSLQKVIAGLKSVCGVFQSVRSSGANLIETHMLYSKVQALFTNAGLQTLLKELWDLATLLDDCGFADRPTTISLKTMTLLTTQAYVHDNPAIAQQVFGFMHRANFFYDYPEYLELLGELRLLKEATHDTVYLLIALLVADLKGKPQSASRVADSLLMVFRQGDETINANRDLVIAVVSQMLETELAARSSHDLAVILALLARLSPFSNQLKQMLLSSTVIERVMATGLLETAEVDLVAALLQLTLVLYWNPENLLIQGPAVVEALFVPLNTVLNKVKSFETAEFVEAIAACKLSLRPEDAIQPTARCARNTHSSYNENLALIRFLFALNRDLQPEGLLSKQYNLLYNVPLELMSSEVGGLKDAISSLVELFSKLSSEQTASPALAVLVEELYKALCDVREKLRGPVRETFMIDDEQFEGLIGPFQVLPETIEPALGKAAEPAFTFHFKADLEADLTVFLQLTPATTSTKVSKVDLFRDHLIAPSTYSGESIVKHIMKASQQTLKIFEAGKEPADDLKLKCSMINGLQGEIKSKFYASPAFKSFLEERILISIKDPKVEVCVFALELFNAILADQSIDFRVKILDFLKDRQHYSDIFSHFMHSADKYERSLGQTSDKADKEAKKHGPYLKQFFIFIQRCCDLCYCDFQTFMELQQPGSNSNFMVVSRVRDFLVTVSEGISPAAQPSESTMELVLEALKALQETLSGPHVENQRVLGHHKDFYKALNQLLEFCYQRLADPAVSNLHLAILQLLEALMEGHIDDITFIPLLRDSLGCPSMIDSLNRLHSQIATLQTHELQGNLVFEIGRRQMQVLLHVCKWVNCTLLELKGKPEDPVALTPQEAFFMDYVGSVELLKEEKLYTAFFPLPIKAKFLTEQSQADIIVNIKRSSQQEKVDDFIGLHKACEEEMNHQLSMSRFRCVKRVSSHWRLASLISFFLIVLINFILLLELSKSDDDIRYHLPIEYLVAMEVLGAAQVLCIALGRCMYWMEFFHTLWFPLFKREESWDTKRQYANPANKSQAVLLHTDRYLYQLGTFEKQEQEKRTNQLLQVSATLQQLQLTAKVQLTRARPVGELEDEAAEMSRPQVSVVSQADASTLEKPEPPPKMDCASLGRLVWHVVYVLLCALAIVDPRIYPLLLLELASLNVNMANILKAVTLNWQQLFLTGLFTLMIVFIFSTWAYFFFYDYYDSESNLYCDSLLSCFFSTLNVGMRAGAIAEPTAAIKVADYSHRVLFDMLFFIIIIVILLNIVFGIIVDTFGQLRDERTEIENDINNVCFVCGEERSLIDMHGEGWEDHIIAVHSPFAYMAFLVHVKNMKEEDCSGLEKYVKDCLARKSADFMPDTSQALINEKVGNRGSS